MRLALSSGIAFGIAASAGPNAGTAGVALREGGFVLYLRHTSTDFSQNDARKSFEDCAHAATSPTGAATKLRPRRTRKAAEDSDRRSACKPVLSDHGDRAPCVRQGGATQRRARRPGRSAAISAQTFSIAGAGRHQR